MSGTDKELIINKVVHHKTRYIAPTFTEALGGTFGKDVTYSPLTQSLDVVV